MSVNIGINIQRSPNRINQQLREAGVEGKFPKLLLDFKDQYYLASGGSKTLANAVTHARSGNATMTDGYGPELVTNGGFDSDSDWTKGTGWSIANGVATSDGAQTGISDLEQPISFIDGKSYIVYLTVTRTAGTLYPKVGNTTGTGISTSGTFTQFITAGLGANLELRADVNFAGSIDSVSVREMPVIKWAPHNLLSYSEDFSNSAWTKSDTSLTSGVSDPAGGSTAFTLTADGPTANNNILSYYSSATAGVSYTSAIWLRRRAGTGTVYIFNPDGGGLTEITSDLTSEWKLFTKTQPATSTNAFVGVRMNLIGDEVEIWGAHVYRSDLGGMVDNPDQPASRASYVPTTSSAKYLPRIGHHVFNGDAWVNEGVLAESELRVNLVDYSDFSSGWQDGGAGSLNLTENSAVSPDGTQNALEVESTGSGSSSYIKPSSAVFTNGLSPTVSVYAKAGTHSIVRIANNNSNDNGAWFDLSDGTIGTDNDAGGHGNTASIENVGNGWYRLSRYFGYVTTGSNDIIIGPSNSDGGTGVAPANTTMYFYGAQAEVGQFNAAAPTASSLIPTSGGNITRAAETFIIPSANLPWPEPNYIGSELVDATSVTAGSGWTVTDADTVSAASIASTYLTETESIASDLVDGNVYFVSAEVTIAGSGTTAGFSTSGGISATARSSTNGTVTIENAFVYDASNEDGNIRVFKTGTNNSVTFDNISVREINPLSVSIAMDGRVTYADTGVNAEAQLSRWYDSSNDYLLIRLDTTTSRTGQMDFIQREGGTTDTVESATKEYSAGILTPFDVSMRSGSTFLNGATDGVALTANTTPTALPDLSATDLLLAYDYMGTIGTFRVWDKDLGDDGIVEATNPSLEPSLSLTFEGTGTNSFVVNNWSN